jgi:Tfp pilus assembly protein PilF
MVKKTLPLAEQALELAQQHLRQGRDLEALHVLGKLVRLEPLEAEVAEAAQSTLADIHLRRRDFAQARRHLHVALVLQPDSAEHHHLMGVALEDDPDVDPRRAGHHYRKAVDLEPSNAEYQVAYGQYLLDLGKTTAGLRRLERAVELTPDDGQYAQHLALAYASADQFDKARRVALHALFRNPDDSRLRRLWDDLRFQEARQAQRRYTLPDDARGEVKLVLLPFGRKRRRQSTTIEQADGTILRFDPPAPSASPKRSRHKKRQSQ